ncbi:hemopexin repeat-containing protein [Streptomyces sp. NRRL F-5630]
MDATLNRRDQPNVGYFFKDDQYVRYDLDADRADSGYPKAIKGNWIFFS